MNPKTVNDLDPKLKETYERVMGTSFAPVSSTAPTQDRPIQTTVEQNEPSPLTPIPPQQPVAKPIPQMVASPQMTKPATPLPGIEIPSASVFKNTAVTKKKKSLKPVIFLIGGAIFFVAYAVIWLKIFGLF